MDEGFSAHLQELRRGTIVLACLELLRIPGYGYGLLQELEHRGFTTDANTLYPLLRRLQKQGYLTSEWNTDEARPRKFYRTSPDGESLGEALGREWQELSDSIGQLTNGSPAGAMPVPGQVAPAPGSATRAPSSATPAPDRATPAPDPAGAPASTQVGQAHDDPPHDAHASGGPLLDTSSGVPSPSEHRPSTAPTDQEH